MVAFLYFFQSASFSECVIRASLEIDFCPPDTQYWRGKRPEHVPSYDDWVNKR